MSSDLKSRYEALLSEILSTQNLQHHETLLEEAFQIGGELALVPDGVPEDIAAILLQSFDTLAIRHPGLSFSEIKAKIDPAHLLMVKGHGAAYRKIVSQEMDALLHKVEAERLALELEIERKRYQLTSRQSSSGIWEWDIEQDQTVWDDRMFEIYDISPEEFKDDLNGWLSRLDPADHNYLKLAIEASLSDQSPLFIVSKLTLRDGSIRHIRTEGTVIYDKRKTPVRMVGIDTIITQEVEFKERLIKKEEHLRLAQSLNGFGIWDWNIITNDLYWDDVTHSLLGLVPLPHESKNKFDTWHQVVHPDDMKRIEQDVKLALSGEKPYIAEFRVVQSDGSVRRLKSTGTVAFDGEGRPLRMFGLTHDVTHDHHILENMKLSQQVIASTTDVVLITEAGLLEDPGPRILFANEAVEKVTGYRPEELIGKTPRIFQGNGTDQATLERIRKALKNWQPVHEEVLNYKKDGTPFWSDLIIAPVADETGWFTHWVSVQRDVTERKANEVKLRVATEAKSRFLANMSHEIRNPLNSVTLLSKLLENEDLDTEKRKDFVNRIAAATKSVTGILDEILDFSKIEAGQTVLERAPFELSAILDEVREIYQVRADAKGLKFEVSSSTFGALILGDQQRLKQVLLNLVGNAIKFTDVGSVYLRADYQRREQNLLEITFDVIDTGIGIPSDALGTLFEPFTQADSGITRKYGGTGLGLSISQSLVDMMGGRLEVKSTPGLGSSFSFSLEMPIATSVFSKGNAETVNESGGLRLLRILLVDDDENNNEAMRALLESMMATVQTARNGAHALKVLKSSPDVFDLVLMDIQMPVMDGITATRKIRTELNLKSLPIIALTAGVLPHQQQEAISVGITELLRKPVDHQLLITALSRYLPNS